MSEIRGLISLIRVRIGARRVSFLHMRVSVTEKDTPIEEIRAQMREKDTRVAKMRAYEPDNRHALPEIDMP